MIGLSKSALEIFTDCPRCFWLAKIKKIERPRGPMPSVVNAIDAQMKALVENHLKDGLAVPYLLGETDTAAHPDRKAVGLFRSWRTFQRVIEVEDLEIKVWGELDDLLLNSDGTVSPWDYKSKGGAPTQEYCEKYNQNQGDMYHLLLEGQTGFKCNGRSIFTYAWPEWSPEIGEIVFRHQNIIMYTDPARATKILHAAAVCLQGGMPASSPGCGYCGYLNKRKGE